jgi:hypothetical protein
MWRTKEKAAGLAARLCRPQRIGVFGYRGVGKTTLLAMLYREAVSGRLPELRLAATDARTADYLADKILQLEAGQQLPGTLAETDLHFHLYHREARLELLVKDYQGEHVELGRDEPVQQFLRDCDAVWLCLDSGSMEQPAELLRRQQEIEQLIEACLSQEPHPALERPVALLLTKADLLESRLQPAKAGTPSQVSLAKLAEGRLAMSCHALGAHCPNQAFFAVSSLGDATEPRILRPQNLAEPLAWLALALQKQDEARLERLWSLAAGDVSLLDRCVACFARRYPSAPATAVFQQRLRDLRRQRLRRRTLIGSTAAACLIASLWCYDALGYHEAERFEDEHAGNPVVNLKSWQSYQAWHPTRNLFQPGAARFAEQRVLDLNEQVRQFQREEQLVELRRRAGDPDADAAAVWQQFRELRILYPEIAEMGELETLGAVLKSRRDEQLQRRAQAAFDHLTRAEHEGVDLSILVLQADQLLRDFAGSKLEMEVRQRRTAYLRQLEERDLLAARNYSARQPFNFQTRREHYQRYLDKYPAGQFTAEAQNALEAIEEDWDRHDFREVRDHFTAHPGEIPLIVARCRSYLAIHPRGRFTAAASDLLRWTERVTAPGEYRVVLRGGHFEKKIARFFSLGPDLSVELEVAGVRYGPSNITVNRYDPEWNYEFPRRIRWKLGDPVRIRVTDHDYWSRVVLDIGFEDGDPLQMRFLGGEVWAGANRLTFESDFHMPELPKIE